MSGIEQEREIPVAELVYTNTYDDFSLFKKDMDAEKIKLKLRLGANPNIVHEAGDTLLMKVIYNSKLNVLFNKVNVILDDERADINKSDKDGYTPFHTVIYRTIRKEESLEFMEVFLAQKGIDLNKSTKDTKITGLIYGVYLFNHYNKMRVDILDRLVEDKRVNVNLTNKVNESALDYLFKKLNFLKERKECLEILMRRKELNLNKQDKKGNTLLMRLLMKLNQSTQQKKINKKLKEIIILILKDSRTDISIKNKKGETIKNITEDVDLLKILLGDI